MFQIAKDVLDESQYEMFSQKGQIDFAYDYESTNSDDDVVRRFRELVHGPRQASHRRSFDHQPDHGL